MPALKDLSLRELTLRKYALLRTQKRIEHKLKDIQLEIQSKCTHSWRWEQVAGDGRTCQLCGKRDYCE